MASYRKPLGSLRGTSIFFLVEIGRSFFFHPDGLTPSGFFVSYLFLTIISMVVINEWMPNPAGRDTAQNEWVELYNPGNTTIDLSGWRISNKKGKSAFLDGFSLSPHKYLVLSRQTTKLELTNTDESVSLYDSSGKLVDKSFFSGQALENQSFSRSGNSFFFTTSTPGFPNTTSTGLALNTQPYPFNTPLAPGHSFLFLLGFTLLVAILITSIVGWLLFTNYEIYHFLFDPDPGSSG